MINCAICKQPFDTSRRKGLLKNVCPECFSIYAAYDKLFNEAMKTIDTLAAEIAAKKETNQ